MPKRINVSDYRKAARKRLPHIVYDFLEGGALDEQTLASNTADLAGSPLQQRIMRDVSGIDLSTSVLGHRLRTPVLIAPMGLLSLFHPQADVHLARAAQAAGTVFVHSAWSGTPLKDVVAAAPGSVWCQAALWADPRLVDQHLERAADAGVDVLVIAGDVSVSSKRERDLHNGFTMRARPSVRGVFNAVRKPRWVSNFLFGPKITFGDQSTEGRPMTIQEMGEFMEADNDRVTWDDVRSIRERWPGKLVVKGIMSPADAQLAIDAGVDGIYISNHGGRQFDAQPSTFSALPAIAETVGDQADILVDSGIRRGSDIVKMRALGATACLIGRPVVYGAVQSGQRGAAAILDILTEELATALAFTGATSLADVGPGTLALNGTLTTAARAGSPRLMGSRR
ncbi:alpha-hydroxy acid oxidase [Streptomyces sp. NPDC055105]|uniref:alpha-hydroxy acid oxidase n=1 Tax=Streptomyces sp. NPDC055105 TaxID=3365719 RepID=UPI0037D09F9E